MATYKGILSFPTLFTPKVAKGGTEPKFSCAILMPANDTQVAGIQAEIAAAKANTFPSGYTGTDECLAPYDEKYAGKEYYDPRFTGWWVLSCSAKADDKPAVVDMAQQPLVDGNKACSGAVVYVSMGISGYTKGKGGIGGWLNGVMVTDEDMPFGRLDGKPSVEQMFAGVGSAPAAPSTPSTPPAAPSTPPVAPSTPPPAPAAPTLVATEKANGATVEAMLAWEGWTEELLVQHGYVIKPSFA